MDMPDIRTGIGYDVHRITAGRKLVLCGVHIPCDFGLDGHSDADVMVHALMDALLGAAGLSDIGTYFPNTDERYRGISSIALLEKVCWLINDNGFMPGNVDIVLISERPKIMNFVPEMKKRVGEALSIDPSRVGVKATTNEAMGFLGRGEGMAALATALLFRESAS